MQKFYISFVIVNISHYKFIRSWFRELTEVKIQAIIFLSNVWNLSTVWLCVFLDCSESMYKNVMFMEIEKASVFVFLLFEFDNILQICDI